MGQGWGKLCFTMIWCPFPIFLTELYEYCIKEGYADKNLIAKWKKQGYENLCCLRCIQTRDTNFGTNCICRVPKSKLEVVMSLSLSWLTFEFDVTVTSEFCPRWHQESLYLSGLEIIWLLDVLLAIPSHPPPRSESLCSGSHARQFGSNCICFVWGPASTPSLSKLLNSMPHLQNGSNNIYL